MTTHTVHQKRAPRVLKTTVVRDENGIEREFFCAERAREFAARVQGREVVR